MKRKLYCIIGGIVLVLMSFLLSAGESGSGREKPVSGNFKKYGETEMISYEAQKENMAKPAVSYMGNERVRILDYDSPKEGQGGMYSCDFLLETKDEKGEDKEGKNTEDVKGKSTKKGGSISLTKEEKEVLLRIVEAEATGEDIMGRMLVANVVLNRVKSDIFPDNVVDVVYASSGGTYQFSPIRDGRFWQVSISQKTKKAVRRVLKGEDYSEGALFFMARRSAKSSSVNWFETHLTMVKQYGGHEFYK